MAWFRSARATSHRSRPHVVAEVVLVVAMLCLMVVTGIRIMTIEAQSGLVEQAPSPLYSGRPTQP